LCQPDALLKAYIMNFNFAQSKKRFSEERKNADKDNIHMNNKGQDIDNKNYWDIIRKSLSNIWPGNTVVNGKCHEHYLPGE
jgi:hypothetical protein